MFCGAYDYEPFVVYGNDVLHRRRRHPGVGRVELIEFDEFNMRPSQSVSQSVCQSLSLPTPPHTHSLALMPV